MCIEPVSDKLAAHCSMIELGAGLCLISLGIAIGMAIAYNIWVND